MFPPLHFGFMIHDSLDMFRVAFPKECSVVLQDTHKFSAEKVIPLSTHLEGSGSNKIKQAALLQDFFKPLICKWAL